MRLRLHGALSEGSGLVNEDRLGFVGDKEEVIAAWVLDGVTGINARSYFSKDSDAKWFVERAQLHLSRLAEGDRPLPALVQDLVTALIEDRGRAGKGIVFPPDYDPPAACLVLAKQYGDRWHAARLGDSALLARTADKLIRIVPDNSFDHQLALDAGRRRREGNYDLDSLLDEFHPVLLAGRKRRNQPGGYGILEASPAAAGHVAYFDLGTPSELLLCTDGFYRAVDHYGISGDGELLQSCSEQGGVQSVLLKIRAVEASDPGCNSYPRFKAADDATALMLVAA